MSNCKKSCKYEVFIIHEDGSDSPAPFVFDFPNDVAEFIFRQSSNFCGILIRKVVL